MTDPAPKGKPAKKDKPARKKTIGVVTVYEFAEGGCLRHISGGYKDTAAAQRWVKNQVKDLEGKTLQIGLMKPPFKLAVETVKKVSFTT